MRASTIRGRVLAARPTGAFSRAAGVSTRTPSQPTAAARALRGSSTVEVRDVAGRLCPSGQHPGCGTGGAPVPPDAASPARAASRDDMDVALVSLSRHQSGTDVVTG